MSLRSKVENLIKKSSEDNLPKEVISEKIYDLLEDEGLSVYGNGWADSPTDLSELISLDDEEAIKISSCKILYQLDMAGLGLDGNGWFDGDPEWNELVELHC
ncbi:hypothetical protein B9J93_03810 [Vibrio sp. V17_P4S1T151]|uniref:hypothetical protein n=1 Tax=unclassified Vibrio TaxID=2614977 RepID=UPI000B8E557B|nr:MULTISPECIES: hypothetical protein [unclassified Vibrio]OXX48827.1 hypothetical protein B9J93_03810 [Vibrio sp. V17_P4S1T151]OXX64636.1 hypothetical protein B9J89_01770 [Vibrio sp. V15_P4S5T153]